MFLPYAKAWKFAIAALVASVALGRIFHVEAQPWFTWTDPLMLDFVIGILIAVGYYKGFALGNKGSLGLVLLGAIAIAAFSDLENPGLTRAATMGVGMGCMVAAVTWRKVPISFPRAGKIINMLSNQTYTMYLCHILVLKVLELVYYRLFGGWWAHIMYIVLGTLVTVVASKVLYEILERPLTEYLRQRIKRPRPA